MLAILESQPRRIPFLPNQTVVNDTPPNSPNFQPDRPSVLISLRGNLDPDFHSLIPMIRTHISSVLDSFVSVSLISLLNPSVTHAYIKPSKIVLNSFVFLSSNLGDFLALSNILRWSRYLDSIHMLDFSSVVDSFSSHLYLPEPKNEKKKQTIFMYFPRY